MVYRKIWIINYKFPKEKNMDQTISESEVREISYNF